jgi:DUF1009 family protein
MRFDVPVVGLRTIEVMRAAGATALALDAGKTLLFDREKLIAAADQAGIAICIYALEGGSNAEKSTGAAKQPAKART